MSIPSPYLGNVDKIDYKKSLIKQQKQDNTVKLEELQIQCI
ncbi:MAG: hypothetical protein ACLRPW_09180 [Intestinibacter sp.]